MSTQKPSKKSGNCRCSGGPPAEWFWEVILRLPDTAVRAESAKKHHPSGGVFGAGDEARTRFPASHEWLSPFAGALPHLRSNVLRTGRGSEFSGAAAHSKKNTPSCRMGYSFWSGRRGSNSLPGIPRMAVAIRRSPASPQIKRASHRSRQRVLRCCGTFQKEYPILSDGVFFLERATRLELATSTLARSRSTR